MILTTKSYIRSDRYHAYRTKKYIRVASFGKFASLFVPTHDNGERERRGGKGGGSHNAGDAEDRAQKIEYLDRMI